jgi:hypothetical protein
LRVAKRADFSDRVRAARDRNLRTMVMRHGTPSFDTQQCAMDFCFLARDDRSNVNAFTANDPTR